MRPHTPLITKIANFDRIENHSHFVMLAWLDNPYLSERNTLASHLVNYAWKLIERMVKPLSLDRFFELLEEQSAVYMETNRVDSRYILKKVLLTKRKTYHLPLYKIEIGSDIECLAAIFFHADLTYNREKR